MAETWYYNFYGEIRGPLSYEQMLGHVRQGFVRRDTFVREGPREDWRYARDDPFLFSDAEKQTALGVGDYYPPVTKPEFPEEQGMLFIYYLAHFVITAIMVATIVALFSI